MKLAFSLLLKDEPATTELLDAIRLAGFDGVEPTFALEGSLPSAASYQKSAERLRQTVAQSSLSISSMRGGPGFWPTFASPDAAKRKSAIELAEKAFEALKITGGDTLLIVPGQWDANQTYAQTWTNAIETAKRIGEIAERAKINVGLENVENKFLLSPRDWMAFLDEVAMPRVKMYFDVGNVVYMRQGYSEQWIRELGRKYITRIHFKDAQIGGPINYLLEGAVNWPAVTSAMKEIGYDDWVGIELNLPAHHAEAMLASQCKAARMILKGGAS